MKTIDPIKKLNAREPKVSNGGMGDRNKPTNHKDLHGTIPAKLNVREIARKLSK
jgi:hypothetical protein